MAQSRPKAGSIVHLEVHSRDPQATKRFYSQVFGWKLQDMPEMDYIMFEPPSPPNGGISAPMEGMPEGVMWYLLSPAIEETAAKIEDAGGRILMPRTEIPNMGWFAVFRDPTGIVQGLFEPKVEQRRAPQRRAASTRSAGRKKSPRSRRR